MNKVPLILFSGGIESTLLLSQNSDTGFDTLEITLENSFDKGIRENIARDQILEKLRNKRRRFKIPYALYGTCDGYSQGLPWITRAFEICRPSIHSCVMIGYCSGDSIASSIPGLINVWDSLWSSLRPETEKVPLVFPLRHQTKAENVQSLTLELLALTVSCESTSGMNPALTCGSCKPCQSRFSALVSTGLSDRIPDSDLQAIADNMFGKPLLERMLNLARGSSRTNGEILPKCN